MLIVKLEPTKSRKFHFGMFGLDIDDSIFHSDSLFSTICNNYISEYGKEKIDEFVKNFPKITSLFYGYHSSDSDLLFVPMPLGKKVPKLEWEKDRKSIKKAKFIELSLLDAPLYLRDDVKIIGNAICKKETEELSFYENIVEEKIAVNYSTGTAKEGALYYVSGIRVNEKAFLYFLIDTPSLSKELQRSIELLKVSGIGGEISSGFGQIKEVKIEKFDNNALNAANGELYTSLSLVIPKEDERKQMKYWDLIERKGYVYHANTLKKSIFALKEGAVFEGPVEGSLVKVADEAYKYGKAFLVKFKI